ncbi:MAG: FecR domain-containing protein, partial [Pedobacter sp.]|nr:FecR domain-containing protein [Pedobacter sp.]
MPANSSIQELFAKYVKGETSVEETTLFFERIAEKEHDAEVTSLLDAEIEDTAFADEYDPAWETTLHKIKSQIAEIPVISVTKRSVPLWSRIAAIASIAAVIVIAFGIYLSSGPERKADYTHLTANDIAPGKMGATLTLANGKKISLSGAANGEIAKESGLSISKTADGQVIYEVQGGQSKSNALNTLSTAIGETYIITLPDQTKVWLNAASSLTYNPALTVNGLRKVKLSGEGYFEVAKDKEHPFIVESGTQSIEVLGTHFNVNAYPDESAYRTTLLEGSVKVEDKGQTKVLQPGNQAANSNGKINLSRV